MASRCRLEYRRTDTLPLPFDLARKSHVDGQKLHGCSLTILVCCAFQSTRYKKLGHRPAVIIPTLDLLVSESRVAKILSFANWLVGCAPPRLPNLQKFAAKVTRFARTFA